LAFITPNLCHDGHDGGEGRTCVDGEPGGLVSTDRFLKTLVRQILESPAYKENGLLIITFDVAAQANEVSELRSPKVARFTGLEMKAPIRPVAPISGPRPAKAATRTASLARIPRRGPARESAGERPHTEVMPDTTTTTVSLRKARRRASAPAQ
jgi:hypothetical protein